MKPYILEPTKLTPKVIFDPANNMFEMTGSSRPEDVRDFYHPILEWLKVFITEISQSGSKIFSKDNPLIFRIKLDYFNSSSAKFLFDIFEELNTINSKLFPVEILLYYDEADEDMKDAGKEMEELVDMGFRFIQTKD